jgi:hypothetical protein
MLSRETEMTVRVYIDRLILDGLPINYSQGPLVQAGVEAELTRLFTENGFAENLQTGGAVPSVRADGIQLTSENSPARLGAQIAGSVYSGIGETK